MPKIKCNVHSNNDLPCSECSKTGIDDVPNERDWNDPQYGGASGPNPVGLQ